MEINGLTQGRLANRPVYRILSYYLGFFKDLEKLKTDILFFPRSLFNKSDNFSGK